MMISRRIQDLRTLLKTLRRYATLRGWQLTEVIDLTIQQYNTIVGI